MKDEKSGKFISQTNLMSMPPVLFHAAIVEFDVVVSTLKGGLIYDSKLEGRRYKAEQMANLNGLKVLDFLPFFVNEGSIVVLSLPEKGILGVLTPFSYFMLFLGFFALSPFIYQFLFNKNNRYSFSFKRRIQLSIIFILSNCFRSLMI